jgi:mevalonate kinase
MHVLGGLMTGAGAGGCWIALEERGTQKSLPLLPAYAAEVAARGDAAHAVGTVK